MTQINSFPWCCRALPSVHCRKLLTQNLAQGGLSGVSWRVKKKSLIVRVSLLVSRNLIWKHLCFKKKYFIFIHINQFFGQLTCSLDLWPMLSVCVTVMSCSRQYTLYCNELYVLMNKFCKEIILCYCCASAKNDIFRLFWNNNSFHPEAESAAFLGVLKETVDLNHLILNLPVKLHSKFWQIKLKLLNTEEQTFTSSY